MTPVISEPMSPAEAQSLEHYERIIAEGLQTFVEVGQALMAIREQRLYRQTHTSFEDYCRERWEMARN